MPPAADHALYTIRELLPDDWDQVARIYAQGIAGGQATFETKVPSREIGTNPPALLPLGCGG